MSTERSIVDVVAAAAVRYADRPAVIGVGESLDYRELWRRARSLAGRLVELGVGPDRLVGVATEASSWTAVAPLAVLAAGGAFVPLDPDYPADRLRAMLTATGDPIVLATSAAARRLPSGTRTLVLDLAEMPDEGASSSPRPDQLAYVTFTSGSTGQPKGVMVPHRGVGNLIAEQIALFGIGPDSRVLQFASLSFDASVSEIFTALAAGAALCVASRDDLAPGPPLADLVARLGVTVVTLPPSALSLLDPADFPTLATVVSAGEACSAALVARWSPGRRFINAYGPTEITVCATMGALDGARSAPSLGVPLAQVDVHLLDGALAKVSDGELGEIYVGGVGVARGYLARPAATAERFVPDPFSGRPGARLYRTGDLARRAGGGLEFGGRVDRQVKVRGHRIEPAEVEAVLRDVAGVSDALVLTREDRPGDVRLVAYVLAPSGVEVAALRTAAAARLPGFARPTDHVVLDRWPLTPNGKVDRDRLPPPAARQPAHSAESLAPRNQIEYRLSLFWQELLGCGDVRVDDDFFELGGHSLLAVRLLGRVKEAFDCDLPLSLLTERRTIAGLAEVIADRGQSPRQASTLRLEQRGHGAPLYLVPPVHGSSLCYLPLCRELDGVRPIVAFQAPGFHTGERPAQTIEELAAHYVGELRALAPVGPYLLGGWSLGGAIALEMALQLGRAGELVPTLLMVDASAPTPYLLEGARKAVGELTDARVAFLYTRNFGRCFGVDLGLAVGDFDGVAPADLGAAVVGHLRRVPAFSPDLDEDSIRPHLEVFGATIRAFLRWQPRGRYGGRTIMFMGKDGHPDFTDQRAEWDAFLEQPPDIHWVTGDHFSLVYPPHVADLARAARAVLVRL